LILRAGDIARPVDVARVLARCGLSLRKAHDALNRLAEGKAVAVELHTSNRRGLIAELAALGIRALAIQPPQADIKKVRRRFGLSQAEFAVRFGLELDTVQNWEQERNAPDQATQLLLKLIEVYPDEVEAVLTDEKSGG
jgi:DNA-binding transcriptional regulator YiaG